MVRRALTRQTRWYQSRCSTFISKDFIVQKPFGKSLEFWPLVTSILTWAQKWPKWFRNYFYRAFERRFMFCSTMRRSRDIRGGVQTPPPPSGGGKSRGPSGRGLWPGHTYTTHGQRTKKSFILASALSFAGCASAFVARLSRTLGLRYLFVIIRCVRRTFCACSKLCAELDAWVHTPEGRQTRAERAGPTPHTRRTIAGYSLYVRRLRCSEHPAHTWRTSSARVANMYRLYVGMLNKGWTILQRAQRPSNVRDESWAHNDALTFYNAPAVRHVGVTKLCEILMKVGRTTTHWRFTMRRPCVM